MYCKKKVLLIFVFYVLLTPINSTSQSNKYKSNSSKIPDIRGTWTWFSKNRSEQFTIKIRDCKPKIFNAQYCAVYNNGTKMDCDFDSINNISGIIKGKIIYVKFYSFFNARGGKAEITIINSNKLLWKIKKNPNGEHYAPLECILVRK